MELACRLASLMAEGELASSELTVGERERTPLTLLHKSATEHAALQYMQQCACYLVSFGCEMQRQLSLASQF